MNLVTLPGFDTGWRWMVWCGLALIGLAAINWLVSAPTYWLQGRLLRAPKWDGRSIGGYAAIEGDVKDPTATRRPQPVGQATREPVVPVTVGMMRVAIGRGTGFSKSPGSSHNEVWHRFHGKGTFLVKTDAGPAIEVEPQHIVWATSVSGRDESVREADYEEFEIIPIGGRVLAAGWIEAGKGGLPSCERKARRRPCSSRRAPSAIRATGSAASGSAGGSRRCSGSCSLPSGWPSWALREARTA